MINLTAPYSKGQLKIQQMAFVLVAFVILFAIAGLFFLSISTSSFREQANELRAEETLETIRSISGTAEFSFTSTGDCASCVDMDKVLALKDRKAYNDFWRNIAFLQLKRISPINNNEECTSQTISNCDTITLIDQPQDRQGYSAFITLCYYEEKEHYYKCDLGKITMAFNTLDRGSNA